MGHKSPRMEVVNPMSQHGKNDSQQTHKHGRKRNNRKQKSNKLDGQEFLHKQCPVHGGTKGGNNAQPTHLPCRGGQTQTQYPQLNKTMQEWQERCVNKRRQTRGQWNAYKGQGITYLYLANTGEVGPWSGNSNGVVWQQGERRFILRFLSRLLLEEIPCWDNILPKKGKHGRGHLMHAIGVNVVRASSPYPLKVRQKLERGEKQNKEFCLGIESGAANTL